MDILKGLLLLGAIRTSSRPAHPSEQLEKCKSFLWGRGGLQKQQELMGLRLQRGRKLQRGELNSADVLIPNEHGQEAGSLAKSLIHGLGEVLLGDRKASKLLAETWGASSTRLVPPSVHF